VKGTTTAPRRSRVSHSKSGSFFVAACLVSFGATELGSDEADLPFERDSRDKGAPREETFAARELVGVDAAIERGVSYLVRAQNPNGSWGSARRTKGLDIYAPVPGAHHAFQCAVTSLAVCALIETAAKNAAALEAVERASTWLIGELPRLRRATPDAIYNIWGHAYGIQALVRLTKRAADDAELVAKLEDRIRGQVALLTRYETVQGGWGYYDFDVGSQKPAGSPTSFTTATVLVALAEARDIGIEVPQGLVKRAVASIRLQEKPDFSYAYGEYLRLQPMRPINRPGGSLGRTQACTFALRRWGDERITHAVLREWLERLIARNLWLDIGRKRPVPHESWFEVAGYFFYYGHYYASLCLEVLDPPDRESLGDRLAAILVRLQEADGSWWDYPLYDYHQSYGTAFALLTLIRCRG
jgi:hypothetical protein